MRERGTGEQMSHGRDGAGGTAMANEQGMGLVNGCAQ